MWRLSGISMCVFGLVQQVKCVPQHVCPFFFAFHFFAKDLPQLHQRRIMPAAYVSIRYVNIRQNTSTQISIRQHTSAAHVSSTRRHTSAYVNICQHASAHVSTRPHTPAYVRIRQHRSAGVSTRQHTSAYASIRPHTSAYASRREHT
jgi:hypothetical protein